MSDWIERMERRIGVRQERDLARRIKDGPVPYQSTELVTDMRGTIERLRADGKTDDADRLEEIAAGIERTMSELMEAISDALD